MSLMAKMANMLSLDAKARRVGSLMKKGAVVEGIRRLEGGILANGMGLTNGRQAQPKATAADQSFLRISHLPISAPVGTVLAALSAPSHAAEALPQVDLGCSRWVLVMFAPMMFCCTFVSNTLRIEPYSIYPCLKTTSSTRRLLTYI
jgi:hypothetical protein